MPSEQVVQPWEKVASRVLVCAGAGCNRPFHRKRTLESVLCPACSRRKYMQQYMRNRYHIEKQLTMFAEEARKRSMTTKQMKALLFKIIITENLTSAILDDADSL